jgi:DNA-binding transcriptional LysR family regulator
MLDVRRLRLLRDLARLGTIAAVAEAHAYTPSAVSQQLAALQREAGVPLIERMGRTVRLTPAGAALTEHTETVLTALEAASAAIAAARTGLHGTIRIGAFPSAVRTLLPATLVALAHEHPGLDLMVSELDPAIMPELLRDRRLDVALLQSYDVLADRADPAIETTPLLEENVYLATRTGLGLEAARGENWIAGTPGTLCHEATLRACRDAGFEPRIRHHVDDFAAALALVAAGQGVALVPQLGALEIPGGVGLTALAIRRRTSVAYRAGAGRHPATAACVAALRKATAEW